MAVKKKPYWAREPQDETLKRIKKAARVIERHEGKPTLRRVTYEMYPEKKGKELNNAYNRTSKDVVRGRVMGLIPWSAVSEERVEEGGGAGWPGPERFLDYHLDVDNLVASYSRDLTPAHNREIECWFEKSTLTEQFKEVCRKYGVKWVSTRGQLTWTKKKDAADNLGGDALILYFGDRDSKGREIKDVIERDLGFLAAEEIGLKAEAAAVEWVAVTEEQEARFGLPEFSRLDAMSPEQIKTLIEEEIRAHIDVEEWAEIREQEKEDKQEIRERLEEIL